MSEVRINKGSILCSRVEGEAEKIEGYASVFNKKSKLISESGKTFYEVIRDGAFDDALASLDLDCVMNRDHDSTKVLARNLNGAGTLALTVDDYGLKYSFVPPNTSLGNETKELVERGDLFESSFKFTVRASDIDWERQGDGTLVRYINRINDLKDTAIVTNGAYANTSMSVSDRGLKEFEEREAKEAEEKEIVRKQELETYYNNLKNNFYDNSGNA